MEENEPLLLEMPLIPDPDADEEMGPADMDAIADDDIKGSRVLLVRRVIEPIDLQGNAGGVVQFACTFQPADGTRFASAQLSFRFTAPAGIKIIDVAPRNISDPQPVEMTLSKTGKLGIKNLPVPLEPEFEIGSTKKYLKYHCQVQGSGEGTGLAVWSFKENPDRKDGIGPEQVLTLTLPVTGNISGTVVVNARLVRKGLGGAVDAVRDLILGPKPDQRSYPLSFEIAAKPAPSLIEKFFGLFG